MKSISAAKFVIILHTSMSFYRKFRMIHIIKFSMIIFDMIVAIMELLQISLLLSVR